MSEQSAGVRVEVASVTDRGLSQKRPLNEDSMLVDAERGIFAVADGVGGAQAGEVASQTAVEVLGEAFRHHKDGDDIEDLMEIAIQRANASIYQMSHEQRQLSMMATTIVALHLDGHQATIGHVGDSRLYRLTPGGRLERETEDHSVVEEEVRAGRMSPSRTASHPAATSSSRARAEQAAKSTEDAGSRDARSPELLRRITRPSPEELRAIWRRRDAGRACAEMKRAASSAARRISHGRPSASALSHRGARNLRPTRRTHATDERTARASAGTKRSTSLGSTATSSDAVKGACPGDMTDTHARRGRHSKLRTTGELAADHSPAHGAAAQTAGATARSPTSARVLWRSCSINRVGGRVSGGMRYQQNQSNARASRQRGGGESARRFRLTTATRRPRATELNDTTRD